MNTINEVTYLDIQGLNDINLTRLLKQLLHMEALKLNLHTKSIRVPLKINVPDGGVDGSVSFGEMKFDEAVLISESFIPHHRCCFQVKATKMTINDCANEIVDKNGHLKTKVKDYINEGGAYVLFTWDDFNEQQEDRRYAEIEERISSIQEKFTETGFKVEKERIFIYEANQIAKWANHYSTVVHWIKEVLGKNRPAEGLKTFSKWQRIENSNFERSYISDSYFNGLRGEIINASFSNGSFTRIVGLSGLGKTRFVYNVFESCEGVKGEMLRSSILYYDAKGYDDNYFCNRISDLSDQSEKCNLIVDNCPLRLHNDLKKELEGTAFNLISISSDPEAINKIKSNEQTIKFSRDIFKTITPNIIENLFGYLNNTDKRRIIEFSDYYPGIAILLAEQLQQDDIQNIGTLADEEIAKKLLALPTDDKNTETILKSIAIFEKIGYTDDLSFQADIIATNKQVCPVDINSDEVAIIRFREVCERYIDRGILEKSGRYISLKPKPLALYLASNWWKSFREKEFINLLSKLIDIDLHESFWRQTSELSKFDKVNNIVEQLTEAKGPFGNAEVLNSELGSRLFRLFVDVNPVAISNCLYREYGGKTIHYLKKVRAGRRNLVWTLEKLCFRNETFQKSAKVLLLLAAAENETWSNNATGQFLQLFHFRLPGTEANYNSRLRIVEFALNHEYPEVQEIGLYAVRQGFKTHQFVRGGGAEVQGSQKSLEDYKPETWDEVYGYWRELENLLRKYYQIDDYKQSVIKLFPEIVEQLHYGKQISILIPLLHEIAESDMGFRWPEMLKTLSRVCNDTNNRLNSEETEALNALKDKLSPDKHDIEYKYKTKIANPDFQALYREDGKNFSQLLEDLVRNFVDEYITDEFLLNQKIDFLFKDYQEQGFAFGLKIFEKFSNDDDRLKFLHRGLSILNELDAEIRNPSVLSGFGRNCSQEVINNFFPELIKQFDIGFVVSLLRNVPLTIGHFDEIIRLIEVQEKDVSLLLGFKYTATTDSLGVNGAIKLYDILQQYGTRGQWVFIQLMFGFIRHGANESWRELKHIFSEILTSEQLLLEKDNTVVEYGIWQSLSENFLLQDKDEAFAARISEAIKNYFFQLREFNLKAESYLNNIISRLIRDYFEISWPEFSEILLVDEEKAISYFYFKECVDDMSSFKGGVLFSHKSSSEKILNWVLNNGSLAASRISLIMPTLLVESDDNENFWQPFALKVLEKFGSNKDVQSSLSQNLGTYTWMGGISNLIMYKIDAFENLRQRSFSNELNEWCENRIESLKTQFKEEKNREEERGYY